MLAETRPDVFVFVTQPDVRLSLVELGAKYGVKGMALEKPMATSMREADAIARICRENGIRCVVSHQQKYLPSLRRLKAIVDSGGIGEVRTIHVGTRAWLSQLGTHFMDYALWVAGGKAATWVVGHVHGRERLSDGHPSPDFVEGTVLLDGGVRIHFECGYLSERNLPADDFWTDNRLTAYGTHGYAWAETNGAWGALTRDSGGEPVSGQAGTWEEMEPGLQVPYYRDFADWMDDADRVHPCNVAISAQGYGILEGMCLSALRHTRIDLPLRDLDYEDVNAQMRRVLPDLRTYSLEEDAT
jgi:predicted dehydrogenase